VKTVTWEVTVTVVMVAVMRKILFGAVFVLAAFLAVTFAVKNPQTITIAWYGGAGFTQPLAVVLGLTLLLGVLLGYVAALLGRVKMQRKFRRPRKPPEDAPARPPDAPAKMPPAVERRPREALSHD